MNRRKFSKYSISALSFFGINKAAAQESGQLSGTWYSVLLLGAMALKLKLEIKEDKSVFLYSLDQGEKGIPGKIKSMANNQFNFDFPMINANLKGRLENGIIKGIFTQGIISSALDFSKDEAFLLKIKTAEKPLDAETFDKLFDASNAPAMVVIAKNDAQKELFFIKGKRSFESEIKVTQNDKWHIGSISKSFTAMLVAIFIERGKLDWHTKLRDLLPADYQMLKEYEDITMLHLLSHRSGLPANPPALKFLSYKRENLNPVPERAEFTKSALKMKPVGPKEKTYVYSNIGFVIAGHILELISGKSWEDLIRQEIFVPLDIKSGGFGAPGEKDKLDHPLGHTKSLIGDKLKPAVIGKDSTDNPVVYGPAGTMHINAQDMTKYLMARALRNKILSQKSWEILETPPFKGDYALGIIKRPDGSFFHNGSNMQWYAEFIYSPKDKYCAFSAANYAFMQTVSDPINDALLGAIEAVKK